MDSCEDNQSKASNKKPLTKEQELDVNIEAETAFNPEKMPEDDKVSRKLLGKRAGKPHPNDSEQDLKKIKLPENKEKNMEMGLENGVKMPKPKKPQEDASSSNAIGKSSKISQQQQEIKNILFHGAKEKTSPETSTSQNCSAITPEGREPPRLPFPAPTRPKPKSRMIKDEPTEKGNQQKQRSKSKKGKKEQLKK